MSGSSGKRWPLFRYLADRFDRYAIVPTPRLIILAASSAPLVAIAHLAGFGRETLILINALFVILSVYDLARLPKRSEIVIERQLPEQCDVGKSLEIAVHLKHPRPVSLQFAIADDVPQSFAGIETPLQGKWDGKEASVRYQVVPQERGDYCFRLLRLRYWGKLGLWAKHWNKRWDQRIKVVPDLSGVRDVLKSQQDSLVLDGKRIFRKERSGSEFYAVREHTPDDDPRLINWQATARTRKLMTNVYRPERGKIVSVLLDCGRMSGIELFGRTKLDVMLEAALVLAAVALRQGDQVSVLAFSDRIQCYVPPGAGLSHLSVIVDKVYALKSDFVEADYATALVHLARLQKKRSMTVLFTDLDNELLEEQLLPHLARLKKNHYVMLVGMRDEVLHEWTRTLTKHAKDAFAKSIAHRFYLRRKARTADLQARGIQVIDVPADELALHAINRYLDIKARDAL